MTSYGPWVATPTVPPPAGVGDQSVDSVLLSCALNSGLLFVCVVAFERLLQWDPGKRYLAPRLYTAGAGVWLPPGPMGWLRQVWHDAGRPGTLEPDGTILVRFCELGFKFSLWGTLLDVVLLPMYYTGKGSAPGFNRFSLSNVRPQSPRFWGVIVAAYILTGIFTRLLVLEWSSFITLRQEHFSRAARGTYGSVAAQVRRSVMVERIPQASRNEQAIREFFQRAFGADAVHDCALQADTRDAYSQLERTFGSASGIPTGSFRTNSVQPQEAALDAGLLREGAQQLGQHTVAVGTRAASWVQEITLGRSATSTAFVTFGSLAQSLIARQVVLSEHGDWLVSGAPEPRDLIWRNVPTPFAQVRSRSTLARVACSFGLLFWSVPVIGIQAWASVGNLQSTFPFMIQLNKWSPVLYGLLTSYLPVLALLGLQGLLPSAFEALATHYEGHKTKSEVQRIVLNRYFGYQLASLYVTVLSGSLWESFREVLNEPRSIFFILSKALPKQAVYFLTYILARAGGGLPILLLRPWGVGCCCRRGTRSSASEPLVRCAFGTEAASLACVLVIGLTYSFIAPAILPACAIFFGLAAVTYRWLFAYVYTPEFDSSGAFWYDLFNSVLLGLLLGTLSLLALAYTYATYTQFLTLLPLPAGIVWFGYYCWSEWGALSRCVPLSDAVAVDSDGIEVDLRAGMFLDPITTEQDSQNLGASETQPAAQFPASA